MTEQTQRRLTAFIAAHEQHDITVTIQSQEDTNRCGGYPILVHFSYHDGDDWMGRNYLGHKIEDLLIAGLNDYDVHGVKR